MNSSVYTILLLIVLSLEKKFCNALVSWPLQLNKRIHIKCVNKISCMRVRVCASKIDAFNFVELTECMLFAYVWMCVYNFSFHFLSQIYIFYVCFSAIWEQTKQKHIAINFIRCIIVVCEFGFVVISSHSSLWPHVANRSQCWKNVDSLILTDGLQNRLVSKRCVQHHNFKRKDKQIAEKVHKTEKRHNKHFK